MTSPFPGMDPYLEQYWPDIHASLIIYTRDQLEDQLPGALIARVEERVVFEREDDAQRSVYPDVQIAEHAARFTTPAMPSGTAVMQPMLIHYPSERRTETFINILEAGGSQRLVSVIELLSPSNKQPGKGEQLYRTKQQELYDTRVSLVEIDLLRGGERVLHVPLKQIPPKLRTTYQVCVHRGWQDSLYEVYAVPLRAPLPAIHIPLRQEDADVHLDLQAVVALAYRKGRYHATIDYAAAPLPPLDGDDAKWAKAQIKKAKKRQG